MKLVQKNWWKIAAIVLVLYAVIGGLLIPVPRLAILNETIRNLYYHVTMWFSMMILLLVCLIYSIKYLTTFDLKFDIIAEQFAKVGFLFGILGIFTGMIWAKFTWGDFWVNDPKLNGAAVTLLIYAAYFLLRQAVKDERQRAKVAAVYNIFAYTMLIVFLMVLPRMTDSLHPGNGGNPAFSSYDLDNTMRLVFYPAVIGWALLGTWIASLQIRLKNIERKLFYEE
jgi:heme exporter protein C